MGRYTNHKHGFVLGYDNHYFVSEGKGAPIRDGYKAVVWLEDFSLAKINARNYLVRTPAQQIVWTDREDDAERTYMLRPWVQRFLTEKVGKCGDAWDIRAQPTGADEQIFFKKKGDALKLIREVHKQLEGLALQGKKYA